jgi:hypothetical protein
VVHNVVFQHFRMFIGSGLKILVEERLTTREPLSIYDSLTVDESSNMRNRLIGLGHPTHDKYVESEVSVLLVVENPAT